MRESTNKSVYPSLVDEARGGGRGGRGGMRECGMRRVSSLHLALRWQHFDAARVLIAAGVGCAMSFIRDDSIYV